MQTTNRRGQALCESGLLERPRYFPRQMITAEEMTLEQKYFRDKLRRHNRFLHGWGVVCGAKVCPILNSKCEMEPWKVKVEPGYALGPYGDEIAIDCEQVVDLRTSGITGITGEPSVGMTDPWCSEVEEICVDQSQGPVYIAVKYREFKTRPVRVQPIGCGCDETQCEYSRWRDGYEIGILPDLPPYHPPETPPSKPNGKEKTQLPECPPCPSDPWVVLAKVDFDDSSGAISAIDNCSHRRLVLALGSYWRQCKDGLSEIDEPLKKREGDNVVELTPLPAGSTATTLVIFGKNLRDDAKIDFGSGVTVVSVTEVEGEEQHPPLDVEVEIKANATLGPRTLTFIDSNCNLITVSEAIEIVPSNQEL